MNRLHTAAAPHTAHDLHVRGGHAQKDAARSSSADLEGHDFSRAEKDGARSATTEGVRGNPLRVSPASSLENTWIEIFRAGGQIGYGVDNSTNGSQSTGLTTASTGSAAGTTTSLSAGTPTGTVSQPTFTGTQFDNRSAFVRVIFCRKT